MDPLAFGGLDHFPTFENVAFRLCRSDGLLLFVELVDPVQPFLVEADSLIVLAQAGHVTPIGRPREADIVGSRIQLLPAYDDVRLFLPLVTFVADQRGALGMDLYSVAHFPEGRNQMLLICNLGFQKTVLAHIPKPPHSGCAASWQPAPLLFPRTGTPQCSMH